jgi:acyl-CoA synthetase (AMP-forming)/AMP-acid ligase II
MLGEIVREAARRFGDASAYVAADGWEITYRQLDRISDELAAGLAHRGIGEGDVVALALPSTPEYPVAYLALAKLGAITAGINERLSPREQAAILDVAQPRLVLATAELAPPGADRGETEESRTEVAEVVLADHAEALFLGLRGDGAPPPLVPDAPERPVAIIFTSGTTGLPKGAVYGNRQLAAITAIDIGDRWGGGGRGLAGTSFAHLGFMTKFAGNLRTGGTTWLTRRWRAADALEQTARLRLSTIAGIPTQVALMLRVPGFDELDLSSIKVIVIGGGPATPALVREARERFAAPVVMRYSCTEAGIGLGTAPDGDPEDAEISVGRPHPGIELTIRDEADQPIAEGEIGEVCLRSPATMTGYYRDPEATARAITADGAIRTGDLGWVDDHGRLRLVGRSKEMYVRGGYNVYPVEVEAVLATHPAVAELAVIPCPDEVMGEIGVAMVVLREGHHHLTLEDLRSAGAGGLAAYKLPEAIEVVEDLPRTAMEKIDRQALREQLQAAYTDTSVR